MAKKSQVTREKRLKETADKYSEERQRLRKESKDLSLSPEQRHAARARLAELPKDSNPIRQTNRCALTGRPRGYIRFAGLSRIAFRDLALRGELPGVRKASF